MENGAVLLKDNLQQLWCIAWETCTPEVPGSVSTGRFQIIEHRKNVEIVKLTNSGLIK